jgi:hypothetical protein
MRCASCAATMCGPSARASRGAPSNNPAPYFGFPAIVAFHFASDRWSRGKKWLGD